MLKKVCKGGVLCLFVCLFVCLFICYYYSVFFSLQPFSFPLNKPKWNSSIFWLDINLYDFDKFEDFADLQPRLQKFYLTLMLQSGSMSYSLYWPLSWSGRNVLMDPHVVFSPVPPGGKRGPRGSGSTLSGEHILTRWALRPFFKASLPIQSARPYPERSWEKKSVLLIYRCAQNKSPFKMFNRCCFLSF